MAEHGTAARYNHGGCRCQSCKMAQAAYCRYRRAVNGSQIRATERRWQQLHSEELKASQWERTRTKRHGLTRAQRNAIYEAQGRGCAGCGVSWPNDKLVIDHDHECPGMRSCGKCVRGLLCYSCNLRDVLFIKRIVNERDAAIARAEQAEAELFLLREGKSA